MIKKSYQQLKEDLEKVIQELESGDIDIDKSVDLYEIGQKLVKELEKYISNTEAKIKKIT